MKTEQQVSILSRITTRDHAGRHFTSLYSDSDLAALEADGLLIINRPVHSSGTPYSAEYQSVEITQDGQDLVDTYPKYHYKTIDDQNDEIRAQVERELPKPAGGFASAEDEDAFREAHEKRFMELVKNYPAKD